MPGAQDPGAAATPADVPADNHNNQNVNTTKGQQQQPEEQQQALEEQGIVLVDHGVHSEEVIGLEGEVVAEEEVLLPGAAANGDPGRTVIVHEEVLKQVRAERAEQGLGRSPRPTNNGGPRGTYVMQPGLSPHRRTLCRGRPLE